MLHLPCYICIAILTAMLILEKFQNQKIQKGLINKILEKQGLEPIGDMVEKLEQLSKKPPKAEPQPVRFNIPNMPVFPKDKTK